jgi:hypothetical protein
MTVYTEIIDDGENYKVSALVSENRGYIMPSFVFFLDGKEIDYWDNDRYLYDVVLPYLKGEMKSDHRDFDFLEDKFSAVRLTVLQLFEKADELGFFNETKSNLK